MVESGFLESTHLDVYPKMIALLHERQLLNRLKDQLNYGCPMKQRRNTA